MPFNMSVAPLLPFRRTTEQLKAAYTLHQRNKVALRTDHLEANTYVTNGGSS